MKIVENSQFSQYLIVYRFFHDDAWQIREAYLARRSPTTFSCNYQISLAGLFWNYPEWGKHSEGFY